MYGADKMYALSMGIHLIGRSLKPGTPGSHGVRHFLFNAKGACKSLARPAARIILDNREMSSFAYNFVCSFSRTLLLRFKVVLLELIDIKCWRTCHCYNFVLSSEHVHRRAPQMIDLQLTHGKKVRRFLSSTNLRR